MTTTKYYYDDGVRIRDIIQIYNRLSPDDITKLMKQGKLPSQYVKIRIKVFGVFPDDILVRPENIFTVVNHGGKK